MPAGMTDPPAGRQRPTKVVAVAAAVLLAGSLLTACSKGESPKTIPSQAASAAATWDAQGHAAAQAAAEKILRTWSRPEVSYQSWWADLKPLLSPEGQELYSYTDPANIPELKITGAGEESNNDNPHVVTITFPTSEGKFGVDLSRTSLQDDWIGESIIFPGESSRLQ